MKRSLLSLTAAVLGLAAHAETEPETGIIRRALPYLEQEGIAWMEERQCVSCHQIPSMLWSFRRAAEAGLLEDSRREKLEEWSAWASDWRHWLSPENIATEEKHADASLEMLAHLLLARPAGAPAADGTTARYREHLLRNQQPDGSWKAGGQFPLARRPAREISEVSSMWILLALGRTEPKAESPSESSRRALAWLAKGAPGNSTEWHALELLLKRQFGPASEIIAATASLLNLQNADGGWPWLAGEPSDALGTGYALYAFAPAPNPEVNAAIQRATQFLIRTQTPEGTWPTPSTRAKDGRKTRDTTTYWGTAWAVTGLLEARAAKPPKVADPAAE